MRIGPNFHPSLKPHTLEHLAKKKFDELGGLVDFDQIRKDILTRTQVVCSTLSVAGSSLLSLCKEAFDTVIIDEAGQAVESLSLIPLQYKCERLIMLGDTRQLPATVFSGICRDLGYGMSLFERLKRNKYPSVFLDVQYRMDRVISRFVSKTFYNGRLRDAADLGGRRDTLFEDVPAFGPFRFYSIVGQEVKTKESFLNTKEADFVKYLLLFWASLRSKKRKTKKLTFPAFQEGVDLESVGIENLPKEKVGVVTPYKAQITYLKTILKDFIKANIVEVQTVDGFQGREKGTGTKYTILLVLFLSIQ